MNTIKFTKKAIQETPAVILKAISDGFLIRSKRGLNTYFLKTDNVRNYHTALRYCNEQNLMTSLNYTNELDFWNYEAKISKKIG